MGVGRCHTGFWERFWRAGLDGGREPEDYGGLEKVEGACLYLLVLGTQRVRVVWATWVCEGPPLWDSGVINGRVGSKWLLGLR